MQNVDPPKLTMKLAELPEWIGRTIQTLDDPVFSGFYTPADIANSLREMLKVLAETQQDEAAELSKPLKNGEHMFSDSTGTHVERWDNGKLLSRFKIADDPAMPAAEPAPVAQGDGYFILRFFRDLTDEQRRFLLVGLGAMPDAPSEPFTHAVQRRILDNLLRQLSGIADHARREAELLADNERLRGAFDDHDETASVHWYGEWVAAKRRADGLEVSLAAATETWTDEAGNTWSPPTAWAYAQACRAYHEAGARAEATEASLAACRALLLAIGSNAAVTSDQLAAIDKLRLGAPHAE